MTYHSILDKLPDDIRLFPNVSTVAFYSPYSQTIHMPRTNALDMQTNIDARTLNNIQDPYSIAMHEITHWADSIGTLWGLNHLRKVYDAFNSTKHNKDVWWRIVDLHDTDRRNSLLDYYTTIRPNAPGHSVYNPWTFDTSIGHEFDLNGRVNRKAPIISAFLENGQAEIESLGSRLKSAHS